MKRILFASSLALTFGLFARPGTARADGCYLCGSGSSTACQDYCRYTGADTFTARKLCAKRGCKVSGTSSCPTSGGYKICRSSSWSERYPARHGLLCALETLETAENPPSNDPREPVR